ncbi:MAG: hypothetical protein AAGB22_09935, partial [Bacteroidota bacterium]
MDKLFRERYAHQDAGGFQEAHWNKLAAQLPVAGAAASGGLLAKMGLSSKALVIAGTATTLTV